MGAAVFLVLALARPPLSGKLAVRLTPSARLIPNREARPTPLPDLTTPGLTNDTRPSARQPLGGGSIRLPIVLQCPVIRQVPRCRSVASEPLNRAVGALSWVPRFGLQNLVAVLWTCLKLAALLCVWAIRHPFTFSVTAENLTLLRPLQMEQAIVVKLGHT